MYNVNVLTECQDEEEMAVVISSVLAMLEEENIDTDLIVRKLKRTTITSPSWSAISREEY